MRTPFITLFALVAATSVHAQVTTTFSGKIRDYHGTDTLFCYTGSMEEGYDTVQISKKGTFAYSLALTEPKRVQMFWQGRGGHSRGITFLLEPGKDVRAELYVTGNQPADYKLAADFKGKNALKSQYENQSFQHFSNTYDFSPETLSSLPTFEDCRQYVDSRMADMNATLDAIRDDDAYVAEARHELAAQRTKALFTFAIEKEKAGTPMKDDAGFQALVNSINPNDTTQLTDILSYLTWAQAANPQQYAPLEGEAAMLRRVKDYTQNQDVRNQVADSYLQTAFFYVMFGASPADPQFKSLYETYLDVSTDTTYQSFVHQALASMQVTSAGSAPSDFPLVDINGRPLTFASLIQPGTVTYFDFWATWCGPCKREIPKLAELAKKYAGNPKVRIVSLSIDEDHEAWQKMVTADKPQWEQYLIPDPQNSAGFTAYGINSIPRFMLFGTDGKLLDGNATRPSDPATEQHIDQLISEIP